LDEAPYKLSGAVAKLAGITFGRLSPSYWIDYLGFITEGKLVAIYIKPSLGVFNWPVIFTSSTNANKFFGTIITAPSIFTSLRLLVAARRTIVANKPANKDRGTGSGNKV
jgi:hypothetical protein